MLEPESIGRILLIAGVVLAVVGLVVIVGGRLGLPFGRLPGDITVQRGPVTVYAPLLSCLVLSVLLTIAANVILWILRR